MKYWIIAIFLLSSIQLFAQPKHAEIEEKDGKKYYVHIVQDGNSLWGIHVLYNTDVEDIVATNPGVENGIKSGQKILIPVKEELKKGEIADVVISPENPVEPKIIKHVVQSKETLFGISKKYSVTVDEIIKANPGTENGVKVGQELVIPGGTMPVPVVVDPNRPKSNKDIKISFTDTIIEHIVLPHETIYSISKRFMVPVEDLKSVNGLRNNKIRNGDLIKIPVRKEKIQKVEIRQVKPVEVKKVDSTFIFKRKKEYEISILLPFFLDKGAGYSATVSDLSTEFYMGAQLAIDSLEKAGLRATIRIYDSQNDTMSLKAILKKSDFQDVDMVIGPLFPDKMNVVARWCEDHKVKYICPVAVNSDILKGNPYVFSAIPSDVTLIEGAAKYLLNKGGNDQNILVKPVSQKDLILYERFRMAYMNLPFKGTRPKLIETNLQDFKTFIKKGGSTFFVVPTTDEATATKFMNALFSVTNNQNDMVSVFGTKDWMQFDGINESYKNKFNFHFSAPNDFNYSYDSMKNLARKYRKNYGADMTKMAVQGYDVMLYFCLKYLLEKNPSTGVMSNFKMVQRGTGNGYENNNCFIMKQEDFELIKLAETYE